jgi:hypothetical protein
MRRSVVGSRVLAGAAVALFLTVGTVGESSAQATGTPIFRAPYRAFTTHEFGASVSDAEGIDVAVEGFYRYGRRANDFGFRAGFADPEGEGDTSFLVGADFRTQVFSYSEDIPVDGALTLGVGGIIGEGDDRFLLPVGISAGRRFDLEGTRTTFVPYVHPVLVPNFTSGDDPEVDFALGLGVDIRFSENVAVRASGGIGDIEGVGISFAYLR